MFGSTDSVKNGTLHDYVAKQFSLVIECDAAYSALTIATGGSLYDHGRSDG